MKRHKIDTTTSISIRENYSVYSLDQHIVAKNNRGRKETAQPLITTVPFSYANVFGPKAGHRPPYWMVMYLCSGCFGCISFFGTSSFRTPSLKEALMSSSFRASPT